MMRKLAVTVFALSLAALGCGSDSGTKPSPDTGVGGETGKADTVSPSDKEVVDAPAGNEVQLDTAKADVSALDAPAVDAPPSVDLPAVDTSKSVDTPAVDGAKPVVDGGVDSAPAVDTGAALDTARVDASSNG